MDNIQKVTEMIREQAYDGSLIPNITAPSRTHVYQHEYDDVSCLDKVLQGKQTNIQFLPDFDTNTMLEDCLYNSAERVARWLDTADNGDRMTIFMPYDTENIGTTFKHDPKSGHITELGTHSVHIVLEKEVNHKKNNPDFILITAYPEIDNVTTRPTHRDLLPVLEQTETYQNASKVKQGFVNCPNV